MNITEKTTKRIFIQMIKVRQEWTNFRNWEDVEKFLLTL